NRRQSEGEGWLRTRKLTDRTAKELEPETEQGDESAQDFEWVQRQGRAEGGKQDKQPETKQVHCVPEQEPADHQTQVPTATVGFLEPHFQRLFVHVAADREENHVEDHVESCRLEHRQRAAGRYRRLKMVLDREPNQRRRAG